MGMLSLGSNDYQTKKIPRPTPLGMPGGYTHWVRSRAPSGEETLQNLTTPQPPLGARGLARALRLPIYANTLDPPLVSALLAMPAKARA
jgi:hypothetical protein